MTYNYSITLDELYRAVGREVYEQCIENRSLARIEERGLFPTPYERDDYKPGGRACGQNFASLQLACQVIDEEGGIIAREGFSSFAEMNVEICDLLNEFPDGHFTKVVIQLVAFANVYQTMSDSYYQARVVSNVIEIPLQEGNNRIIRIDCQRLMYPPKQ